MLDMLTADAAAKHGHYSPPNSPQGNGYFLAQMPLSLLGSILHKQPASTAPDDAMTAMGSPHGHHSTPMTSEPETPISPAPSRPASSSSNASLDGKPKKRAPRPKTTYNLAQPPPITGPRQKLHLRPKVLLQLHQVIPSRRPKPVYEIIPFSLLAPRSTRRLARTFRTRERLGPHDLLIVKAEEYGHKDGENRSDDERWGGRDVIGILCPSKKGDKDPSDRTLLLLDDGSSWEVTNMQNGGYEFNYTDDHGLSLKRRWIPKPIHSRRVSGMSNASQLLPSPTFGPDEKKFNFSTISANSRRHPVIASMTKASIDVLEAYAMPSATSPPTPGMPSPGHMSPLATPASLSDLSSFMEKKDGLPVKTDDTLRRFIVLSGIWVALSENWSPAYNFSKNVACPYPISTSSTFRPAPPVRTVSMSMLDSPRSASPASTIDENRRSIPRLFRSGSQKLQNRSSFSNTVSSPQSAKTSPTSSPVVKTRSRRSNSTGTADLFPRNGSMRKRYGLPLEDQALPETEEERQGKRSSELLRIKELSLPEIPAEVPVSTPNLTPAPIHIIRPSEDDEPLHSPPLASPNERGRKTQSAYNPITTAGLWDSGVTDGPPKLKSRPTSLVVLNEKKEKAKKKKERSKSKETDRDEGSRTRSERFKSRFLGIFRKDRH